jgi:hypothetical protein
MKLIYDTINETLLPWPRIDDEPIVGLAPELLEMTLIENEEPSYNPGTQVLSQSDVVDVEAQTVTRTWTVTDLKYPAEQWTSRFLTSLQIIGLQRLEMALVTSGQTLGPAMTGMKQWLEGILLASSIDPAPKSDWPEPPVTYEAASQEAASQLSAI